MAFHSLVAHYTKVTIDIGTGDGLFIYKSAQRNPHQFFIGIDANRRALEKISEKIFRRPAKGGLSNALFVQAAVEELPPELNGIASEVEVQFPWGSLLRGVADGDQLVMANLRRMCAPRAQLRALIGLDPVRDWLNWERQGLPPLTVEYIQTVLASRYETAGFSIVKTQQLSWSDVSELQTSWARRLKHSSSRLFFRIVAEAVSRQRSTRA